MALEEREDSIRQRELGCEKANTKIDAAMKSNHETMQQLAEDRKLLEQQRMNFESEVQVCRMKDTTSFVLQQL